jgi:predicted RNase H-like nuclease (RuvC/YqgF family)
MTRGKYAVKAQIKRETEVVASEIATYQNAVKRLTKELSEAKEKLETERRISSKEIRTLRALMESNVSPELSAAHEVIKNLREKMDQIERSLVGFEKFKGKLFDYCIAALMASGFTRDDAMNVLISSFVDNGRFMVMVDDSQGGNLSKVSLYQIQKTKNRKSVMYEDKEWCDRFSKAVNQMKELSA